MYVEPYSHASLCNGGVVLHQVFAYVTTHNGYCYYFRMQGCYPFGQPAYLFNISLTIAGRQTAHDIAAFAKDSYLTPVRTLGPQDFPAVTHDHYPWFIDFFAPVGIYNYNITIHNDHKNSNEFLQ